MRNLMLSTVLVLVGCGGSPDVNGTDGGAVGQGPQGPMGVAGKDGKDGAPGAQGLPGKDGIAGKDGAPGAVGATGQQGLQGPQGAQGAPGVSNIPGPPGATGPQGAQGPQGVQGVAGKDGAPGTQGPAGQVGADGPQGVAGPSIVVKTKLNMQLGLPLPNDAAFGNTTGAFVLIYKSAVSGIADNWIVGSQMNVVYFSGSTCGGDAFLNVSGAGNAWALTQHLYWDGMTSDSNLYKITGTYSGSETLNSMTFNAGPGIVNCKTIPAQAATGFATLAAAYNFNIPATLPWTLAVQ